MKKLHKLFEDLNKVARKVMHENGGMENAHWSYIKGRFATNVPNSGNLEVCVPGGEITRNQLSTIQKKLYEAIMPVLPKWYLDNQDQYFIEFVPSDHEFGFCVLVGIAGSYRPESQKGHRYRYADYKVHTRYT